MAANLEKVLSGASAAEVWGFAKIGNKKYDKSRTNILLFIVLFYTKMEAFSSDMRSFTL